MPDYVTLVFTDEFVDSFITLSPADQRRIRCALRQLDEDDTTPSLHVHQLHGQQAGLWTAYASKSLRITFVRLPGARKRLIEASHHYGD
jgi:hypothetical protein